MKTSKTPAFNIDSRPNKTARGMTKTSYRSDHVGHQSDDACRLSVRGTTDTLHGLTYCVEIIPCPCCGGKTPNCKRRLNDMGRKRLRVARARVAARSQQ